MEREGLLLHREVGQRWRGTLVDNASTRSVSGDGGTAVDDGRPCLTRQQQSYESVCSGADVGAAISRDLVGKAERWRLLAKEPLTGPPRRLHEDRSLLPETSPLIAADVDKHEVAAYYVKDALAGRESTPCIHDRASLNALKIVRNKRWNHVLNVCTILHLALPMLEIQRCLPCMGPQELPSSYDSNALHKGWRPTILGSMWIECLLCLLYTYDLYQVNLSSSNHVHERIDGPHNSGTINGGGGGITHKTNKPRRQYLVRLPPWQLARTCMVAFLAVGLLTNIVAHYVFRVTWHRWSRVILPFLFISRRTYLKHFVGGMIRVLPRMLPVAFLMSFVVFFYAFLAYIIYRHEPRDLSFLGDLDLFSEPSSSALTFLRIFMSIPFMLDVEELYSGSKGIQVMGLSYGVIMVIFLGALVPAVANRNFQYQSKESYLWVNEQRKLALTRAYLLLKADDRTVGRGDWVRLMTFLRPDCDKEHTSALFDAAEKADKKHGIPDYDGDRLSKGGFFMLCALGRATFSQAQPDIFGSRRSASLWKRIRMRVHAAMLWNLPGSRLSLSMQLLYLAVLIQGYQIVVDGDDPEDRPGWAYPLGRWLIIFFCANACLRMVAGGALSYVMQWRHALGMVLSVIGVMYYLGLWPPGSGWRKLYHILQASRLVTLWNVLHNIGGTSSEVAKRLEFVFPAVLRSSFVLFSVTYSYAVLAYAMYCSTPLGTAPFDSVIDHSMTQRWLFYKDAISFASLHESFASMTDVIMLSNWPIFMDAAGDVGSTVVARLFFYSFKGLTFYFVMPVMLGFIVQSYMAAQLPGLEANTPAFSNPGGASKAVSPEGPNPQRRTSLRASPKNGGTLAGDDSAGSYARAFGFSTLAEGSDKHIDVVVDEPSDGDSSSDDEPSAPVMVTSHHRSVSQAFWGAEQAKDHVGSEEASNMKEALTRMEAENARLRALMDSMQMDLQMANARLYDEMQAQPHRDVTSSPGWGSRRGGGNNDRAGPKFPSPEAPTMRKRVGSANSMGGMEAIVESDEECDAV